MSCWPSQRSNSTPTLRIVVAIAQAALIMVMAGLTVTAGAAAHTDDEIKVVPSAYRDTARDYGIPPLLFYAMALQESGRTVATFYRPWPWTLNVDGAAYYYDSKTEMWDALREFVMQGQTNIGIGLLQVTYPYNRHVLHDVYAAIDPHTNLRMGAIILRERYRESGDWWIAVGRYHSPGKGPAQLDRAQAYRERVRTQWERLYGPYAGELD